MFIQCGTEKPFFPLSSAFSDFLFEVRITAFCNYLRYEIMESLNHDSYNFMLVLHSCTANMSQFFVVVVDRLLTAKTETVLLIQLSLELESET